jgi:hypothetical protein
MPADNPGALRVRAKSNQVVDYHYDDTQPGKPLYLLIPGGLIALVSLALIVYLAYSTWFNGSMDSSTGLSLMLLLAPFYVGGVFVFSYGYELYNIPKALRDTAIIVFITLAAVVIVAVLFFVVGGLSSGKSRSSSRSSSSGSGQTLASGGGGGWLGGFGPVFVNTGMPTQTVTREVVREVPVAPPAPQPITCPNCGRSYIPAEHHYACPNCGAPTPAEFVPAPNDAASESPRA